MELIMKKFEELCSIIARITDKPEERVDYLTVNDYLQLRQHIIVCGKCSDLIDDTLKNHKHEEKKLDVNFGGASEN